MRSGESNLYLSDRESIGVGSGVLGDVETYEASIKGGRVGSCQPRLQKVVGLCLSHDLLFTQTSSLMYVISHHSVASIEN